ncbi:MAG: FecR domain-containing protein [Alphaproteobacteria bacterium]
MAADSADIAGAALTAIPSIQAVLGEAAPRSIAVGNNIFRNESITTGPSGHLHILFRDESNMTLGPNAKLVIDEFIYDPDSGTGNVVLQQAEGIMRFVGGAISKTGNVTINTTVGTIGVRGGVVLVNALDTGGVQVFFVFGDQVSFDSVTGDNLILNDIGFSFSVDPSGAIGEPIEINPDELGETMNSLESPDSTAVRVSVPDAALSNLQDRLEQQSIDPDTGLTGDLGEVEPVTIDELETILGLDVLEEQAIQEVFDDQAEELEDDNVVTGS